jgi:hypothetical protein
MEPKAAQRKRSEGNFDGEPFPQSVTGLISFRSRRVALDCHGTGGTAPPNHSMCLRGHAIPPAGPTS